jgi:hypothetical protein
MAKKDSEIIRGFQLMAAYHHNGTFNNTSYHSLSKTTKYADENKKSWDVLKESDWEEREFEKSADGMYKVLMQFDYFLRLQEWGSSVNDLLSDGATIGFYVGLVRHWEKLGKPTVKTNAKGTTFGKNAYILLDRLIVEVMRGQWGGSGDSKAERLIREMNNQPDSMLKKVEDGTWKEVWTELVCGTGSFKDSNSCCSKTTHDESCRHKLTEGVLLSGKVASKQKMNTKKQTIPSWVQKILIHYYCTSDIPSFMTEPEYSESKINWDHIIPDSKFTGGSEEAVFCNNIGNACALPNHENIVKSANFLTHPDCNSGSTKKMIERYSELKLDTEASKYDDAKKAQALCLHRGKLLMDNFISKRTNHF